jgi:hypothetical protein
MVLKDQIFANMSHRAFIDGIRPKVDGSWELHLATLSQPLDFFVMLSSLSGFLGNPGQANYAAGCTCQVALAAHRRGTGLPATTVDLGRVAEVGYVAEKGVGSNLDRLLKQKLSFEISEDEFLAMLELAMLRPEENGVRNGHLISDPHFGGEEEPSMSLPVLSQLVHRPTLGSTGSSNSASDDHHRPLSVLLSSTKDPEKQHVIVLDGLCRKLARLLMMEVEEIDPTKPTNAYPVDSLVVVELRNWFAREAKTDMAIFEILQATSLRNLAAKVVAKAGWSRKATS